MLNYSPLKIDLPKDILNCIVNDREIQLNRLALYAANWYLRCLQFDTQHQNQADWWMQYFSKSAALAVGEIGKLECIPVTGDAATVTISSDLKDDRIGYLFVKLNQSMTSAEIIGFISKYSEIVRIDRLQSTDKFIDYLCDLEAQNISIPPIDLGEWFAGIFDGIWQNIDELAFTSAYRSRRSLFAVKSTGGGRRIKLGDLPESPSIILTVEYHQTDAVNFDLYLQIYPALPAATLPIDLKFSAIAAGVEIGSVRTKLGDVSGEIVLENGKKGEEFSIQIEFNGIDLIESFKI